MEELIIAGVWFFWLFIWIVFGAICAKMAEDRGRNGLIGFLLGFCFNIFGVLFYALIGKTEEKKLEDETKRMKKMKEIMREE